MAGLALANADFGHRLVNARSPNNDIGQGVVIDKWRHVIGVISTDVRVDKGKAVYAGLQRFVYSRADGFVKDC